MLNCGLGCSFPSIYNHDTVKLTFPPHFYSFSPIMCVFLLGSVIPLMLLESVKIDLLEIQRTACIEGGANETACNEMVCTASFPTTKIEHLEVSVLV